MKHLGDFDASTVVYGKFTSAQPSTGAPFALAGSPALSVYKDNSATQSTAGITLTASFDSVTGLNHYAIDTSADGAFYAAGSFFSIVLTAGTVDGVSVVGQVIAEFTIRKNSALKPTVAGRTLDVSAGGESGLDWANIGSPTTAVNLSGTNIDVDQVVASVSGNVSGNVTGSVGSVAASGITRASFAADTGVQTVRSGTAQGGGVSTITLDAGASATNDFYNNHLVYITGGTGAGQARFAGNDAGSYVGSTKVLTVTAPWVINPDNTSTFAMLPGAAIGSAAPSAATVAAAVWNATMASHLASGSTGEALNAAGAAGDPWVTTLPGSYSVNQAGYILGVNLNAQVASRAAQTTADTILSGVGTLLVVGDKLDDTFENDGGTWRFTTNALEQAPAGGGGTSDWTANEKTAIRNALGIPLSGTVLLDPSEGILDMIRDAVAAVPTAIQNADALLNRDLGSGTLAGALNERTPRSAFREIRNAISTTETAGKLTVYKEDDATVAHRKALVTSPTAEAITATNPD